MPLYGTIAEVEVTNEVQLAPTSVFREGAVESDDDLSIKVQSFFYVINAIHGKFVGALGQAVADDDTTYVYLDAAETLQVTNAGYPAATHIRLARVVAQGGIIVRIIHERAFLSAVDGSGFTAIDDYGEDDSSTTTPNSAFVEAFKHTTPSLPAGNYVISWYFEVKNSNHNSITRTRVQLDDSAGHADLAFQDKSIRTPEVEEHVSGFQKVALSAGVHTVDIDFYPFTGVTGEVRRKRIVIRRVP